MLQELFYQIMWVNLIMSYFMMFVNNLTLLWNPQWQRHHGLIALLNDIMLYTKKLLKIQNQIDMTYTFDVIVSWAISAKNALQTCYSINSNQLVFGQGANSHNLVNLIPSIEDVSNADIIIKQLNTLHKARQLLLKQNLISDLVL